MLERLNKSLHNLWNDRTFRIVLAIFIISKLLVLTAGYAGYFMIPEENSFRKLITDNELLNPWAQYDGRAYLDIAENGYRADFDGGGNYGFYPFYPLLIKVFSFVGYDLSAFLISNIFSLLGVVLLYFIIKKEFGDEVTKKSVFYLLFFPTAYFFTAMYTESLFLFLSLLTFYFARSEKWFLAGIFGFLSSLTRVQGLLLFLPLLYLYLKQKQFKFDRIKPNILFIFLIPAGIIVFFTYLYLITGDFFIQFTSFAANYTAFSMPWTPFINAFTGLINAMELKNVLYHSFNIFISLFFVGLSLISFKYMEKDYSIYFLLSALLPLFSSNLVAVSRYLITIFPAFILLPLLEKTHSKFSKSLKFAYIISIIILILLTVRHVNMHLDVYGL